MKHMPSTSSPELGAEGQKQAVARTFEVTVAITVGCRPPSTPALHREQVEGGMEAHPLHCGNAQLASCARGAACSDPSKSRRCGAKPKMRPFISSPRKQSSTEQVMETGAMRAHLCSALVTSSGPMALVVKAKSMSWAVTSLKPTRRP